MEQHPIPQNISSYQFRLVGDMTLKQFFQLAGGILVGLIFYSSPLLPIIKWPFAILSVILGIGLAFLPLEERPLERWIFAFFRAIYSPTLFYWKRGSVNEKFFQDEPAQGSAIPQVDETVEKYLGGGTRKIETPLGKLEAAEKGFLSGLTSIFSNLVQPVKPAGTLSTPDNSSTPIPVAEEEGLKIPSSTPVKIVQEASKPVAVVEEKAPYQSLSGVSPVIAGEEMISTRQALFSVDAAPPNPPVTPNIVVGQVVDSERKIVEGAIMEIRDALGRPIRALKSNKLGHFIIVTPLDTGKYDIITDKEGFEFTPVTFEAIGAIIPPILVQGKKVEIESPVVPIQPNTGQSVVNQGVQI